MDAMQDSTDLYHARKWNELRVRMFRDGYLFLRQILPKRPILAALADLDVSPSFSGTYHPATCSFPDTKAKEVKKGDYYVRYNDRQRTEQIDQKWTKSLIEPLKLDELLQQLLMVDHAIVRPQDAWLRVKRATTKAQNDRKFTGTIEHADIFFFHRDGFFGAQHASETERKCDLCHGVLPEERKMADGVDVYCRACAENYIPLYTCWIPMVEVDSSLGKGGSVLEVLTGSHHMYGFSTAMECYGNELPSDYKKQLKRSDYQWCKPSVVRPGDIIIFNCKTVHRAAPHVSTTSRVSLDVRVLATARKHRERKRLEEESEYCIREIKKVLTEQAALTAKQFWREQSANVIFLSAVIQALRYDRYGPDKHAKLMEPIREMTNLFEKCELSKEAHSIFNVEAAWSMMDKRWFRETKCKKPREKTEWKAFCETIEQDVTTIDDWTALFTLTWIETVDKTRRSKLVRWALSRLDEIRACYSYIKFKRGVAKELTRETQTILYFVTHFVFCVTDWGRNPFPSVLKDALPWLFIWVRDRLLYLVDNWSNHNVEVIMEMATIFLLIQPSHYDDPLLQQVLRIALEMPQHYIRGPPEWSCSKEQGTLVYHTLFVYAFFFQVYIKCHNKKQ